MSRGAALLLPPALPYMARIRLQRYLIRHCANTIGAYSFARELRKQLDTQKFRWKTFSQACMAQQFA